MVAAADAAAVQTQILKVLHKIGEDLVALSLVEVFGRGDGVVRAELDGQAVLCEAVGKGDHAVVRIVLEEHAVDAHRHLERAEKLVVALLHIVHHVAGDVDAGDLILVALRERNDALGGEKIGYRERRVDEHAVALRDAVHHHLQRVRLGKRLAAGEHEIALWRDLMEHADALAHLFHAEAFGILVFLLIDAERAVVFAVVRNEHRDGRAALAGHIRIVVCHILHLHGVISKRYYNTALTEKPEKNNIKLKKTKIFRFYSLSTSRPRGKAPAPER